MRKMSSTQRIEINRFWNELEDIFEKLEEKKVDDKYSTIEEAENIMNETVECDNEVEAVLDNYVTESERDCKENYSEEGYCSGPEEEGEDRESYKVFQNQEIHQFFQPQEYPLLHNLPLPPSFQQTKSLIEIFHHKHHTPSS